MKIKALFLLFVFFASFAFSESKVIEADINGTIHPITAEYFMRTIDFAVEQHAQLVIVKLETPGGLMESMRSIISKMINSPIPVAIYVAPGGSRAASAGFYIMMAADLAVMAPGTHTGSAHPVFGDDPGDTENSKTLMKKITEDSVADIRNYATHRQRNVDAAVKAVMESVSYTEEEALKEHLIDFIATDVKDLLKKAEAQGIRRFNGQMIRPNLANATIVPFPMSKRERFLALLADPNIAFILISLGTLGLMIELYNPGSIFPGIVGVISLVLFFFSSQVLPVNYTGMALILFALALFILEIKIASHGLLTVGGVISLALGATMLFDAPIPEMRVSRGLILGMTILIGSTMAFLLTVIIRAYKKKPTTGLQGLLQEIGTAQTDIDPEGDVFVHGELWHAVSPERISRGEKVRILSAQGLILKVERYNGTSA